MCGASAKENGTGVLFEVTAAELANMITCNGVKIEDATGGFDGCSSYDWYNFCTVTGYVDLVAGRNVITFTNLGPAMNVDYLELKTEDATLSW